MSKQHSSVRAYGILVNHGEIALVRSSNPNHQPPLWWLPGGGIDFGETPEQTLEREFLEETGLQIDSPTLLNVTADTRRRDNGDKIHTVRIIYTVSLVAGELTHEVHGTTDHAAWFDLDQLGDLNLADYARAAIDHYVGRLAD
jgi:ADP-ribose pyrophosphatase YjhB (NUDIX family)